ncbi:MAG: PhoH family protein [Defluviitaleaceae bacterium]|nr:PhoH family protein [Defluviitaleaceae bacterium]MCL2239112.1 PhoH family protein [Defluviitaleaceae bacterium]
MESPHVPKRNIEIPNALIVNVFGKLDENVKKIELAFQVTVINRDDSISIMGLDPTSRADKAEAVIKKLVAFAKKGEQITEQKVNYLIAMIEDEHPLPQGGEFNEIEKISDDTVCVSISGKPVKPKTVGQKKYIDLIRQNTITFAVGPAGTGKTYLAMAMAITAFRTGQVNRIILTRPAIEAGEKLGFLPGDLQQKVDPYLRPLYDALHDIMGAETFLRNLERHLIEVAPLAYMRGRTLDNSFIVLDEAQNTTPEQMKMFLTRLGNNSKAVITGDITQIDLPEGKQSGLTQGVKILDNIPDIGIMHLSARDVVRHPLVQKIISAYDKLQARTAYKEKRRLK